LEVEEEGERVESWEEVGVVEVEVEIEVDMAGD
jgi:hypothetical protein